jgi:phytoene dehydrogenase-like protein
MAGLTAAHRLAPHGQVSVVQRGWRLGGKGASHRTADGRIEEHGLHVWLGYYDNAFRLMREVYEHVDRSRTDPDCPVRTWRDGFLPSDDVVVFDRHRGGWAPWAAHLRRNAQVPGLPVDGPTLDELVRRALGLLADLSSSVGWRPRRADERRAVYLSARAPAATRISTPLTACVTWMIWSAGPAWPP